MVVSAELDRVSSLNLREVVLQLVRFGVLNAHHHILSQPIVVEPNVRPILIGGALQLINSPLVGRGKAERLEGWPLGLGQAINIGVAHVAGGKLVDGAAAEVSGNAKR